MKMNQLIVVALVVVMMVVVGAKEEQQPIEDDTMTFSDCPSFPPRPRPSSVYDLRPVDIRYIGAIGDSITAGFAIEGGIKEYRDESWSIGGGYGKVTLPNYIRHYNPNITGMSMKDHFPEVHGSKHIYPSDYLNAAQSEAKVGDINDQQVDYLVGEIKRLNISDQDWKIITLWIGANDICVSCLNRSDESVAAFEQKYETALQNIHQNIPRAFVNMIPTMNLSYLAKIDRKRLGCDILHSVISECHCVFKEKQDKWTIMDEFTQMYNAKIHELAAKYNALDDQSAFVVQPFLEQTIIPDKSYLSTLDCFHPSLKTHRSLATVLWNQMLTPIANKVNVIKDFQQAPVCPQEDTLFYAQ